jgi:hypothetical protein
MVRDGVQPVTNVFAGLAPNKTETSGALTYEALVRFSKIAFGQSSRIRSHNGQTNQR